MDELINYVFGSAPLQFDANTLVKLIIFCVVLEIFSTVVSHFSNLGN